MAPLTALASALGIAWSSSVSLYATVGFTGVAGRLGWVTLPDGLRVLENPWVIGVALLLTAVEIAASLVPGVATAWEAAHAAVRPLDEQFAELLEFFHRRELGLTLPDFDNLVGFVDEAVAAEQDFAANVAEEIGVSFHGDGQGGPGGLVIGGRWYRRCDR